MTNLQEIWKDIPSYIGYYQVSTFGRVKSLRRLVIPLAGPNYYRKEKIRKTPLDHGYPIVSLAIHPAALSTYVHSLVAITFLGHVPGGGLHINHIDGNKTNNHVGNLELVTPKENLYHAVRLGLNLSARPGERNIFAKLTDK